MHYLCSKISKNDDNGRKQKLVSLIVPCYNEERALPCFYEETCKVIDAISRYDFELFFINDGSKDKTLSVMEQLQSRDARVSYVNLSRNFGKENAMLAGFDYVRGDAVIIMDADLQDPPALIPQMLEYWEQGYEDVYAKRANRGKESWLRRFSRSCSTRFWTAPPALRYCRM